MTPDAVRALERVLAVAECHLNRFTALPEDVELLRRSLLSPSSPVEAVAWGVFMGDKCVNAYATIKALREDYPVGQEGLCHVRPLCPIPPTPSPATPSAVGVAREKFCKAAREERDAWHELAVEWKALGSQRYGAAVASVEMAYHALLAAEQAGKGGV